MFSFHQNAHNQQIEYSDQARPDKPICFFEAIWPNKSTDRSILVELQFWIWKIFYSFACWHIWLCALLEIWWAHAVGSGHQEFKSQHHVIATWWMRKLLQRWQAISIWRMWERFICFKQQRAARLARFILQRNAWVLQGLQRCVHSSFASIA